jgi:hypothetical protein
MTSNGHLHNYTIQIKNHSKLDVQVNCVSLWSKGQRISDPIFLKDITVPADRTVPIQLDAKQDVAQRLWQLAESPPVMANKPIARLHGLSGEFNAEVRVLLRCEVLGIEKEFEETRTVHVDFINRQIDGL